MVRPQVAMSVEPFTEEMYQTTSVGVACCTASSARRHTASRYREVRGTKHLHAREGGKDIASMGLLLFRFGDTDLKVSLAERQDPQGRCLLYCCTTGNALQNKVAIMK